MAFPASGGGTGIGNGEETLHTIAASGASQALNFANGATQQITLTADCTFTLAGFVSGKACYLTLKLVQDATGSRLVTWPTVTWIGTGTAPTLQTAAGAVDSVVLFSEDGGTTIYGVAQTSASGLASGTSFPGSPSDGDLFYRSDSRILYEYDSTSGHWLSVDRQYVPFGPGDSLFSSSLTTPVGLLPMPESMYLESWEATTYVATTNDGSNYYTFTLQGLAPGAPSVTTLGSFSTAADTVGNWVAHSVPLALVVTPATYAALNVKPTQTGSPGSGQAPSMLIVRKVG